MYFSPENRPSIAPDTLRCARALAAIDPALMRRFIGWLCVEHAVAKFLHRVVVAVHNIEKPHLTLLLLQENKNRTLPIYKSVVDRAMHL